MVRRTASRPANERPPRARRATLAPLLLLACALAAAAALPEARLRLHLDWTDNLFLDSLGTADLGRGLALQLRHSPLPGLSLEGELDRTEWGDVQDLGATRGRLALQLGGGSGRFERRWLTLETEALAYGPSYELYDARHQRLAGGVLWRATDVLRLKARGQAALHRFPQAPDSLSAGNVDGGLAAGLNLALDWPLAVDLEAGLQGQRWTELPEPASTSHGWASLRLSRPLGERTGLQLRASLRRQFETGEAERLALADAGLDSGELLRDSWRLEAGTTRLGRAWRSSLSLATGGDAFLGLPAAGLGDRDDRTTALAVESRRAFDAGPVRLWLLLRASREWRASSDGAQDGASTRLGLELLFEGR